MRFLMATTFYPPYAFGGDATYVYRLSNELARAGHDVDVVHCADAYRVLRRTEPAATVDNHERVRVHTLRSRAGRLSPLVTQQTGRLGLKRATVDALIGRHRYDVFHYHNMSLVGLDMLTLGRGVKLYTTHEHWLVCPTHVLWRNRREACTKQTCLSCQLRTGRPPQWWRYGTRIADWTGHVDRFLCPSRFTMAKHRELGFRGPMTHLPLFVPDASEATDDGRPQARPYALFVGRLETIKGVQNLLRVFRQYAECDLVVVGDGDHGPELRRQSADLTHVRFLGRLEHAELRRWYRHAVALVVPSICFEVFGIVVLEAFAESTPALVTNYGALPELIEASGGGVVYRSDEELVSGLERLRDDPAARATLGANGRRALERLWSPRPHLARYLEVIAEVHQANGHATESPATPRAAPGRGVSG